jgi:hypothetical protein
MRQGIIGAAALAAGLSCVTTTKTKIFYTTPFPDITSTISKNYES